MTEVLLCLLLPARARAARAELTEVAITRERLCATARLREVIGDRMESVSVHAAAALDAAPHAARAHLAEAARIARQAAEQIRQVVAEQKTEVVRPAPPRRFRLMSRAWEMEKARRDLADAAALRERLRVARDSHDLLGLGLAAVALKCDLAGRLIGRDDARARAEMTALMRLAEQTRADMRKVTAGAHDLSFPAEVAAARQLLTSNGVEVHAVHHSPLPPPVDAVLATVLREAVTNVLRHARATRCDIHLVEDVGGVRLRVINDGVLTKQRPAGRGLRNLKTRAAAMGGRVVTRSGGDHFEVTVRVPLQPPVAAGDAHGVHPVAGAELRHG